MKRVTWIDAARGVAIILVVFGHVLGGTIARGWLSADGFAHYVYNYIYLFHMPLFFIISGFFCIAPMRTNPLGALISRTETIMWPYFFWEFFIRTLLLPLVGQFMSSPPTDIGWSSRLGQALSGELSWFLWTLYVMEVGLIPFARLPTSLLFLASLLLCFGSQGLSLGPFNGVFNHLPFLLFGAWLRPALDRLEIRARWSPLCLSIAGFLLLAIALNHNWTSSRPIWIGCGIAGSLAILLLVQYLGQALMAKLAYLGTATLAIYLLHPYFQKAAGELVLRLFGPTIVLHLFVATLAGVLAPLAVWTLSQRFAPWLFRVKLFKVAKTTQVPS